MGRSTLADVARLAGVSPSTASLAFSGTGPVAAATRERIARAAEQLGYQGPDPRARSLRSGRTGVVAVILGERLGYAFSDPMLVQLLDAFAERLGDRGVSMLLVSGDESSPQPSAARVATLPMDAAVFADCGTWSGPLQEHLRHRNVPAVAIDGSPDLEMARVWIDDAHGAALALRHVAGLGHRRIGALTLPLSWDGRSGELAEADLVGPAARGGGVARVRVDGTLAAAEELRASGRVVDLRFVEAAGNVLAAGEEAARVLLDRPDGRRPTAVVAQSDVLALATLRVAEGLGLQVPGDLSVVGFDGVELALAPAAVLTTVVQPFRGKGTAAADLLFALLDGARPSSVQLPVELRVGTTSAPPPELTPRPLA